MVDSVRSKAGVDEAAETDPTRWMHAAGMEPDPWQRDVLTGEKRTLMNVTRQGGKSITAASAALDTAEADADALVLILAPARRQSRELLMKCRTLYRDLNPPTRIEKWSELRLAFENNSRIVALPGQEATIRGYSDVDLLIADEAARVPDVLYRAVRPMLGVSDGRILALTTPAGKRGWFYEAWTDPDQDWNRVEVAGWDCPRLPDKFLARERREMGQYLFQQEYECRFSDRVSSLFGRDEIEAAVDPGIPPLFQGGNDDLIDPTIEALDL